jgi:hypothetical protein
MSGDGYAYMFQGNVYSGAQVCSRVHMLEFGSCHAPITHVYHLPLTCPNNIQGEQQICSYLQTANDIITLCLMASSFHIVTRELPETSKHLCQVKTIHGTDPCEPSIWRFHINSQSLLISLLHNHSAHPYVIIGYLVSLSPRPS